MARQLNCTLYASGAPVAAGTKLMAWLDPDSETILHPGVVEEPGRLIFHLPDGGPYGGAWIKLDLDGYHPTEARVVLPHENATEGPSFDLEPLFTKLRPIHKDGLQFADDTNARWLWKGASDFLLYKRYLDGEDLTHVLLQRASAGANLLRVFGMGPDFAHPGAYFRPQDYPTYFESLPAFGKLLEGYGLYLEFVVFAAAQDIMPKVSEQQAHFEKVCNVIRA